MPIDTPKLSDGDALDAIRRLLDRREWSPDTTAEIAEIVRLSGREVGDVSECMNPSRCGALGICICPTTGGRS